MARSNKMTTQEALALAENPATPQKKLEQILEAYRVNDSWGDAVAEALAKNPQMSPRLLLGWLAHHYAIDVAKNPIWYLLALENPGWINELSDTERWHFEGVLHANADLRAHFFGSQKIILVDKEEGDYQWAEVFSQRPEKIFVYASGWVEPIWYRGDYAYYPSWEKFMSAQSFEPDMTLEQFLEYSQIEKTQVGAIGERGFAPFDLRVNPPSAAQILAFRALAPGLAKKYDTLLKMERLSDPGLPLRQKATDLVNKIIHAGDVLLSPADQRRFCADLAERALPFWDAAMPVPKKTDENPRWVIEVVRSFADGTSSLQELHHAEITASSLGRWAAARAGSCAPKEKYPWEARHGMAIRVAHLACAAASIPSAIIPSLVDFVVATVGFLYMDLKNMGTALYHSHNALSEEKHGTISANQRAALNLVRDHWKEVVEALSPEAIKTLLLSYIKGDEKKTSMSS